MQLIRPSRKNSEGGYVLITLLLIVTLLFLALATVLPSITFAIKRDREEELIHRGTQYSRAIRAYYKKFGRYPTRLEELESSNNLRFLRKRYKDPTTGQDFKLLHFGEVKLTLSGGLGGNTGINGATPLNGPSPSSPGGFGGASTFNSPSGLNSGANGGFNSSANAGTNNATAGTTATPDQTQNPDPNTTPNATPGPGSTSQPDQLSSQTFGGGPIVGVVSTSKKDGVREFNHKRKYAEWQFIYDPATDRGGLLMTPNQPQLQGFGSQNGQSLQPNNNPPTTNGPIPGMMNNPNPGMTPTGPPASTPDQPQQ